MSYNAPAYNWEIGIDQNRPAKCRVLLISYGEFSGWAFRQWSVCCTSATCSAIGEFYP